MRKRVRWCKWEEIGKLLADEEEVGVMYRSVKSG